MAEERVQRRLAAILAADVVGYSRLIREDEEGTLSKFKDCLNAVIDPNLARYGGRIVKTMGDGFLVEFSSAVDAVKSAMDLQTAMGERNASLDDDERMEFRVGINLGDVVIDGDDIHGDGVNVAARLESISEPGGICISGKVYEEVRDRIHVVLEDLGEREVKNINRPVRVWRWSPTEALVSEVSPPKLELPDKPSIAVLPFENMSGDPEQEYFSDGLAEDLITDLSKISGLFVIARNSSFAFKGQPIDVRRVAEELGVRHVLEGSVRKAGGKVRINAQLIDAASGGHIWAERYDGDLEDIFSLQDNITAQIVAALQVSLTPTDEALTERKPTDSVEAYDLFLKGRANFHRYTSENHLEAIKCLEGAIEIDPNFANAYGYLSFCHFRGWHEMLPGFNLDRANELAERGIALDGTSAFALARLGYIQTFLRRYDQAITNFEKAIALAPNNAEVYATFGNVLNYWGNPERGLQMLEKAFRVETFVPPLWEYYALHSHLLLRQYDQTLTRFNRVIERAPKITSPYVYLACVYVELDRLDDARNAIKMLLEINPHYTVKKAAGRLPWRIDEVRNRILDSLRKAGVPEG